MLELNKAKLPDTIEVDGGFFQIKTDYRAWLNFSQIIKDPDAKLGDFDFLYMDQQKKPWDLREAFNQLYDFFQPYRELPRHTPGDSKTQVLDYIIDAPYIYAAFMEQYHLDLFQTDRNGKAVELHWHKFLALIEGLHGTRLNEIIQYRCWKKPGKNDTEDRYYAQQKDAWELPTPEREAARKAREHFNSLIYNKK